MSHASTAAIDQPTSAGLAMKPRLSVCTPPSPSTDVVAPYPKSSDLPTSLAPTSPGSEEDSDVESSDYHHVCPENEEREGRYIDSTPTSRQLGEFKSSLLVQMQAAALLRLLKDEMEHENDDSAEESKDQNNVINGVGEDVETIQKNPAAGGDDVTTETSEYANTPTHEQTDGTDAQMSKEDVLQGRPELIEVFRGISLMRRLLASEEPQGEGESRVVDDIHPSATEESTIPAAVGHMEQEQAAEQSNEVAKNTTPAISEAPSQPSDDAESTREVHDRMLESQLVFENFLSTYLANQFGQSSKQHLSDVFNFYPLQFGPGRSRTATVSTGMYGEEEEAQDSGVELDDATYIRPQVVQVIQTTSVDRAAE
ncbi:hypothetical protein Moror_7308 [Moniliophthora roreri MCA 2997]|uniref:Uncharacterized protein n=1 Tax=Moniliophthora roreri (strain MCA 2997) TaxID=1381753 RepID=V2XR14_MONRO|nr:hypothetical protein Moror_7308 [Moniliophthora roreri MCA 2997]